ncbi:MAG: cyanophycinase [Proteobacteria bacterium]|nr:cyanophycinase [Pseudomonadota bacterium]
MFRISVRCLAVFLGGFALLTILSGACVAAPAAAHNYRNADFDYFVSGDPAAPRAAHTERGYALMGGGGEVDAAFRFLAERAGHGHIVILRAASADDAYDPTDGDIDEDFVKRWGPVASAQTIVFRSRAAASDPRVLAVLHGADGIFLAGGDQSRYVNYWKGTPVNAALDAHVRANRPIGGSSAGLAILAGHGYTAMDGGSMESRVALADPFDSGMTLESDFLHFPGLEDLVTDTHFSARSRLGRLLAFVARLRGEPGNARVFGIGVDEKTALLVGADGVGRLAQGSAGAAWVVLPAASAPALEHGKPLSIADWRLLRMNAASRIDLASRTVEKPDAQATLSLVGGKLAKPSIAAPILQRAVTPPDES